MLASLLQGSEKGLPILLRILGTLCWSVRHILTFVFVIHQCFRRWTCQTAHQTAICGLYLLVLIRHTAGNVSVCNEQPQT